MGEELIVVLNRRDDPTAGLGFSLLDKPGFPPVIYDIEENSPAAECGKVSDSHVISLAWFSYAHRTIVLIVLV